MQPTAADLRKNRLLRGHRELVSALCNRECPLRPRAPSSRSEALTGWSRPPPPTWKRERKPGKINPHSTIAPCRPLHRRELSVRVTTMAQGATRPPADGDGPTACEHRQPAHKDAEIADGIYPPSVVMYRSRARS